jgi:hypothetical protein
MSNSSNMVYTQQGGSTSTLELAKLGSSVSDGYRGAITLAVGPAATRALVGVA